MDEHFKPGVFLLSWLSFPLTKAVVFSSGPTSFPGGASTSSRPTPSHCGQLHDQ